MINRIALVTGGGKGIGEAIANSFAKAGIDVAVAARTRDDVDRVASQLGAHGSRALGVVCDVTNRESIMAVVDRVKAELGPITILVNNAGQGGSHKFIGHDDALWQRLIDVNLNSVYYVTKAVVSMMVEANWGRIINIASIASKVGARYTAAYTASKHGVLGLTRALAVEFASSNITVNAICPAYVDTAMTDGTIANMARRTKMSKVEAKSFLERLSPQNRLMTVDEVAHVALMLIDENARGITGQAINVDGGAVMF